MAEYIGAYRVERELGQGGMGEVFLAWDERLERLVAIKRIRHDAGLTDVQRDRFRREARLAARLSHPSIVQVHDLVTDAQGDAIVMEYVEGQTLRQFLSAALPSLAEALRLTREIAEGLAAAHAAGLIHRDLKSDNVIVTPSGHAKILDFGLARPVAHGPEETSITRDGVIVGTCYAMSPEQVSGGELDGRSDLFSLGALLYEMLTGRAPFRGRTSVDSLRMVAFEEPPALIRVRPDVPPELSELVERLLAKKREARPRDAREVTASLERLEVLARSTPPPSTARTGENTTEAFPIQPPGSGSAPRALSFADERAPWRRRGIAAVVLAVAVAVALFVAIPREREAPQPLQVVTPQPSPPPLRVVVLPPQVPSKDESLQLAGAAVHYETMQALSSFQGLRVIDPEQLRETGIQNIKAADAARITDADEVVVIELRRQGQEGVVAELLLRRSSGRDATMPGMSDPIAFSLENLRLRKDRIHHALVQLYPEHPPRQNVPRQEVSDKDYLAFMAVWQRLQAGEVRLQDDLQELERIVSGSPDFLEAQLQGVRVAIFLFQTLSDKEFLAKAQAFAEGARAFDPKNPRTLMAKFDVLLAEQKDADAEVILNEIERLLPGDPEVQFLRAQLAEHREQLGEAVKQQREVVQLTNSWKHIGYLARLEARNGDVESARKRLRNLEEQEPDNSRILGWVAENELLYGDLDKAETNYDRLLDLEETERHSYTNLGMVLFLRGKYKEAERVYREAQRLDPRSPVVQLNLADVLVELGRRQDAEKLYSQALATLEAREREGRFSAGSEMMKAQCLARLGRHREAVDAAQNAWQRDPENAQLHLEAALVYSLADELNHAVRSARTAVEKGVRLRWFGGSAFETLRNHPDFRSLLEARPGQDRPVP